MIMLPETMFVIPFHDGQHYTSGVPCYLNLESMRVAGLTNKGFDYDSICKVFRELFSQIGEDGNAPWKQQRILPPIVDNNLEIKLRVLDYLNNNEPLMDDDIPFLRNIHKRLSNKSKKILPSDIFTETHKK